MRRYTTGRRARRDATQRQAKAPEADAGGAGAVAPASETALRVETTPEEERK